MSEHSKKRMNATNDQCRPVSLASGRKKHPAGISLRVLALLGVASGSAGAAEPFEFRVRFAGSGVSEPDPVARVQVLRTADADHPVSVDILTEPLTASPDQDYTPVTGTVTFQPGELLRLVEIPILNDGDTEPFETFRVVLRHAAEGTISATEGAAVVTITDNDPGFALESRHVNTAEGDGEVRLGVRRGTDRPGRISVDYTVSAGTATAGLDFEPARGTLSFDTHEPIQAIRIPIHDDSARELAEEFAVVLSNPTPGTSLGQPAVASVRIADNDLGVNFASSTAQVGEAAGAAHLSVSLEATPLGRASVSYTVVPMSATADLDYAAVEGTLSFSPQEPRQTIRIPILDDRVREGSETFRVLLHDPDGSGVLGGRRVATVTILDDDRGFRLELISNPVLETDGKAVLSVHRSSDAPGRQTVEYATEPASATPGVDYTPVSGTLTFAPQEASRRIEVPIHADLENEGSESFRVVLSNPSTGESLGAPSTITVRIQENPNGFRFDNATQSVAESSGVALLRVDRGALPAGVASVDYAVENGSALEGVDYVAVRGTLVFADGEAYQFIEVPVLNDGFKEPAETFRVVLSHPSPGASLGRPNILVVVIEDNDLGFGFSAGGVAGFAEQAGVAEVYVYRGSDGLEPVSVEYEVLPTTATPDLDYIPAAGTLVFGPGEADKPIRVPILNDALLERSETFRVVLRNPSPGAALGSPSTIIVRLDDNDQGFILECASSDPSCTSLGENGGVANVAVVIAGDFTLTEAVSVEVLTVPRDARPDQDYESRWQRLSFAPGERRQTVSVRAVNDTEAESSEVFQVVLRNPVGLRIGSPAALEFNIVDNERGYWILGPGFRVSEGAPGVQVEIYRDGDFGFASAVNYRTLALEEPGAAKPGEDFLPVWGTVTFGPGETRQIILVPLLDDGIVELPEPFLLELTDPTGGVPIYESQSQFEIEDNELNPLRVDPDFRPAVRYQPPGYGEAGRGLSFLPDGRMILPTPLWRLTGEDGEGIVRLLHNGDLDPAFAMAKVLGLRALAVQANGQVLIGGDPDLRVNNLDSGHVIRLNADGSLDEAFQARWPALPGTTVTALAVQPDGKVLVATSSASGGALLRLEPEGATDPLFQVARIADAVERIVVDHAGRVLIGGRLFWSAPNNQPRPGLARLLPNGALDAAYLANWPFGNPIQRFALEADDSVLVSFDEPQGSLVRVRPEGGVDESFRPELTLPVNGFAPAAGGQIVVATAPPSGIPRGGLVSRLNADGSSDQTFSPGTYTVTFATSGSWWWYPTLALEAAPGGDLLVTGDAMTVNGQGAPGPVWLVMDTPSPRLEVDAGSASLGETNGWVSVKLVRPGDTSAPLTVHWATADGTARAGVDFVAASGTVTFNPGERQQTLALQLLDNAEPDEDRELRLRLTEAGGSALPDVALAIVNEDPGFVPQASGVTVNGRYLLKLTGHQGRPSLELERSDDLIHWQPWLRPYDEPQWLDTEPPPAGSARRFYRVRGDDIP